MEYRQLPQEEYADLSSRILYEDNHLLVVDKKAGEITQGDKTGDEPLPEKYKALIAMRDSKPGKVFLGVPHRLDRPVCGICILLIVLLINSSFSSMSFSLCMTASWLLNESGGVENA